MNRSQRWLVVVSLFAAASISASIFLKYEETYFIEYGGRFYQKSLTGPEIITPLITISVEPAVSTHDEIDTLLGPRPRKLKGIFPREGLSVFEAALLGVALPAVLAVSAFYILLGSHRPALASDAPGLGGAQAQERLVASHASRGIKVRTPWDKDIVVCKFASLAVVVFPMLIVIDLSSMMILTSLRLPRWVFAFLVLRSLGR